MNKVKRVNQFGRSMIEMLGVLAIIGVLSVGGIAGYTNAIHKYKINKTIAQITAIVSNTYHLHMSTNGGLNDDALYTNALDLDIVPNDMIIGEATGTVDKNVITASEHYLGICTSITGTPRLEINIYNITDSKTCIDLSSADWKQLGAYTYGITPDGDNIYAVVGEDWLDDGSYENNGSYPNYIASIKGSTVPVPVPMPIAASICKYCSAEYPCEFSMIYVLDPRGARRS